jgi:hypothetical protein
VVLVVVTGEKAALEEPPPALPMLLPPEVVLAVEGTPGPMVRGWTRALKRNFASPRATMISILSRWH